METTVGNFYPEKYGFKKQLPDPNVGSGNYVYYSKVISGIEFRAYELSDDDYERYVDCYNIFWVSIKKNNINPLNFLCCYKSYSDLVQAESYDSYSTSDIAYTIFNEYMGPIRRTYKLEKLGII